MLVAFIRWQVETQRQRQNMSPKRKDTSIFMNFDATLFAIDSQHRALLLIWSESHLTENRSVETQCQIETPFICNRKIIQIKVGIVQKSANRKQKQVELIWGMKESTEAKSEKSSTVRAPN